MRKLLIPLMKSEDPVLWGLLAVVAGYALLGAVIAWHRSRQINAQRRPVAHD